LKLTVSIQKSVDQVDAQVERLRHEFELVVDFDQPVQQNTAHSSRNFQLMLQVRVVRQKSGIVLGLPEVVVDVVTLKNIHYVFKFVAAEESFVLVKKFILGADNS
jgi:hypothetical protein